MWFDYRRTRYPNYYSGFGSVPYPPMVTRNNFMSDMSGSINAADFDDGYWVWDDMYDV